jgi:hypothetical protein
VGKIAGEKREKICHMIMTKQSAFEIFMMPLSATVQKVHLRASTILYTVLSEDSQRERKN